MSRPAALPRFRFLGHGVAHGHFLPWTQLVLFAALLFALPAWARRGGTISGNERAALLRKAQPLIDKATAASAAGDFATAAKALGSAYRSAPLPEVLLQLARLAQAEKRTVDAYDLYRRYLADPTRIPDDVNQREAEAVLVAPPPPSGSLTVSGPPSALVMVDGRMVGVLPLPQPLLLSPTDHTLVLDLGGKHLDTPLPIAEGRLFEVRVSKGAGALLINVLPALLVIDEWPGLAVELMRPFTDAIERGAIAQQLGVMPKAVALQKGAELQGCLATLPCKQQLAKRSGLDYVLQSRVARVAPPSPSPTTSWTFTLSLVHVEVGEPASSVSATCSPCTIEQATARYRDALTDLLTRGLGRQFGTAQISSDPPGATVEVAALERGKTPLSLPLWEGKYDLSLKLPEHKPANQEVAIAGGQQVPVSVKLESTDAGAVVATSTTAQPQSARLPRPRWRLALGGSLISAGAIFLTVSGGLYALNRNPLYCFPDPSNMPGVACQYVYDTAPAAGATLGTGLLMGIAGGILILIPGARRP